MTNVSVIFDDTRTIYTCTSNNNVLVFDGTLTEGAVCINDVCIADYELDEDSNMLTLQFNNGDDDAVYDVSYANDGDEAMLRVAAKLLQA